MKKKLPVRAGQQKRHKKEKDSSGQPAHSFLGFGQHPEVDHDGSFFVHGEGVASIRWYALRACIGHARPCVARGTTTSSTARLVSISRLRRSPDTDGTLSQAPDPVLRPANASHRSIWRDEARHLAKRDPQQR